MNNIKIDDNNIFGFWQTIDNKIIDDIQLQQIKLWAISLKKFNKNINIYIITKEHIIPAIKLINYNINLIYSKYEWYNDIFINTPLEFKINNIISKKFSLAEFSDIVRLALLYKFGGSWIDIDDISVRKIPEIKNSISIMLWKNIKVKTYWGSTFNLIPGNKYDIKYKDYNFHIQNDPMINWDSNHLFLKLWMNQIINYNPVDWGQKIPTDMLLNSNNNYLYDLINLKQQYEYLLHPAYGNKNKKGPMFSYNNLKPELPDYDTNLNIHTFWKTLTYTFTYYSYFIVKNCKNIGIIQNKCKNDNKWFIGHLCECNEQKNYNILSKINCINNELNLKKKYNITFTNPITLLSKYQYRTYKNYDYLSYEAYNVSILYLNNKEVNNLFNNDNIELNDIELNNNGLIIILWFVKDKGRKWGSLNYIGVLYYNNFIELINNCSNNKINWIIKPKKNKNILGPRYADPRLFKRIINNKLELGLIGYVRLSEKSNIPNMPDYYVRVTYLNLSKFELDIINKTQKVTPYNKTNSIKLNGFELMYDYNSTNDDNKTHIPTKNIVPLNYILPINNISCFIDFTNPINNNKPLITIVDTNDIKLLNKSYIIDNHNLINGYRGSTPLIEFLLNEEKYWITIIHKRLEKPLYYKYKILIFNSKNVKIGNVYLNLPNECIISYNLPNMLDDFIFITGLIINNIIYNDNEIILDLIISYGINDKHSGFNKISIKIDNKSNINNIGNNNKINIKKYNDNNTDNSEQYVIANMNTYIKKNMKHSKYLNENEKKLIYFGTKYKINNILSEYYECYINNCKWYLFKKHFDKL